jgi:hypothetical protein
MQKELLHEMLAEASGKRGKNATFDFSEADKASLLLLGAEGSLLPIEAVSHVEIKDGYVAVRAAKDDLYLLQLDRVVGIKLQRGGRDGAGFLP